MKNHPKTNVWLFFLSVYVLSTLLVLPVILSKKGMSSSLNSMLVAVFTCVPSILGIVFTRLTKTPAERKDFWRRAFRWPGGHTKTALLGIFIMPALVLIAYLISSYIDGMPVSITGILHTFSNWKNLLLFLFVELTFGALSEELGWRGYALDELQARWGAFPSSIVLGLIWAFWHTPTFLIPGLSQYEWGGIFSWTYFVFMVSIVFGAVIITWVYNRTGRSILVAGFLMHFTQNATLILLAGIFDTFRMPASFWGMMLAESFLAAILLTCLSKKHDKRP